MKRRHATLALASTLLPLVPRTAHAAAYKFFNPGHYLFASGGTVSSGAFDFWLNARTSSNGIVFRGIEQSYTWKSLEPTKDSYDFSQITNDLTHLSNLGKGQKLVIQIQYKAFGQGEYTVPTYVKNTSGWVYQSSTGSWDPCIWVSGVQTRIKALFSKLGSTLDSRAGLQMVCISESAPSVTLSNLGVSEDTYGNAIVTLQEYLHSVFPTTYAVQYTNFPKSQLLKIANSMRSTGVGLGGPDVRAQTPTDGSDGLVGTQSSPGVYNFYKNYWGWLPSGQAVSNTVIRAAAVQYPDYFWPAGAGNPDASLSDIFTTASTKLGLNILFWLTKGDRQTEIINFVTNKVQASGLPGGLNATTPTK